MNRRIAMVALSLLMISLVGGSLVSAARGGKIKPIRGFHVVTNFSETMYAGSAYEAYYRFRNIAKQEVPVRVRFIIIGPEIGTGEWFVDVTIDGDEVGCDEVGPGIFESSECRVSPKSWHDLRIGVSSRPDILPSTYALTIELHPTKVTGEIVDFIVPKRVILDEVAEFTVLFKNTGDVPLAARAFVEVRKDKKGKIVATENGALVEVGVGETVYLAVSWDTSDAKPGKYRAIAWVRFDSASTSTTKPEKFKVKHGEKPRALTMEYTCESCAASNHHQDPKKVSCEGDPVSASPVRILATDKKNPDDPKAKIWFDGEVNLNEEFVIDATNAGETKLKSNTYVFIYATDNTLLQTIKFHTSCSQPLVKGDQFGSLKLVGFIPESECVVSGKHVARISTGDDASSIDNSMLDNSILENASLGDNSVPDNSTAPDSDASLDDNSVPDSLGDNSTPDTSGDASLGDDNSAPDNSMPDNSTSLGDDNSVPENSTSSGENSSALDNSDASPDDNSAFDDSASQEIGDNVTFPENDNNVIMDENTFGENNDISARDNGTILENEGATHEGVTEENSDFDEGTSEVSENASPDDDSAPDNSLSPEIGGAENSTINNEGSGLAENSSADNENAGLAENTITDNENPEIGGTLVDNGCTENSENTLANDENSEIGGVVQVPLEGV